MQRRPTVLYTTSVMASFARNDIALLGSRARVLVFHFAPRYKWLTPWELLRQAVFLLFRSPGASVTVTQFAGYHSVLPVLLGRLFKLPSVLVLGGFECASFPSFGYGAHHRFPMGPLTRFSLRRATHLVPCSTDLVESEPGYAVGTGDPVRQGYKAFDPANHTPFTVIPYGYDAERFRPVGERIPGSFLTVAQMSQPNVTRKGIDLILAVAARMPKQRFTIVGHVEGIRYGEVPPNVELIGFVPYEHLPAMYSRHAFYLQLSVWEGFPSAPCEAMLCGCVPIVSPVASLPDIVGDVGFYLERRDIDRLEAILRSALTDAPEKRSAAARERIMHLFPPSVRDRFLDLVLRVAGGGQGATP